MIIRLWRYCWRFAIFRALFRLVEIEADFEKKKGPPKLLGPKRRRSPF